jgi:hypothetical protein
MNVSANKNCEDYFYQSSIDSVVDSEEMRLRKRGFDEQFPGEKKP